MSDQILEFETIVVGASISGSITACLLGRAGQRVALIDPQAFPRQKACGEGLSSIGKQYFQGLGLWSEELEQTAYPFRGYSIQFSDGSSVCLAADSGYEGCGVSRIRLDSHIYDCATREYTVTPFHSRLLRRHRVGNWWVVETDAGDILQAKNIVFAVGGLHGKKLLPELVGAEDRSERFGLAFWAEGYWSEKAPDTVKIFNREEGQYILTPLSATRLNVSMLLNSKNRRSKSAILETAKALLTEEGFTVIFATDTKGAAAINSYRLNATNSDFFVVGDAIERFDPIGGVGMTHAVFSAECAVRAILQNPHDSGKACRQYYKEHKRGARLLRLLTKMSLGLNVKDNTILRMLVIGAPRSSFGVLSFLKSLFPKLNFSLRKEFPGESINSEAHLGCYQPEIHGGNRL